jgi:hypothetical protein
MTPGSWPGARVGSSCVAQHTTQVGQRSALDFCFDLEFGTPPVISPASSTNSKAICMRMRTYGISVMTRPYTQAGTVSAELVWMSEPFSLISRLEAPT